MTFDFENNFTEFKNINDLQLEGDYEKNRMYFFSDKLENFL